MLELTRVAVATRPGSPRERLDAVLAALRQPARVVFFDVEPNPAASRDIRASPPPAGRSGLVPEAVAALIEERGLCGVDVRRSRLHWADPAPGNRSRSDTTRTSTPHRGSRPGEAGRGCRHPRHAAGVHLHRLFRDRHRAQPTPDRCDLGRGARHAQAGAAPDPRSVDGVQEGTWILGDYLDVVLHVFTPDARGYYKLEDLWSDVPAVELDAAAAS